MTIGPPPVVQNPGGRLTTGRFRDSRLAVGEWRDTSGNLVIPTFLQSPYYRDSQPLPQSGIRF